MHISVLLNESIESLNIKGNGKYIDATLGYAGHSSEILRRLEKEEEVRKRGVPFRLWSRWRSSKI